MTISELYTAAMRLTSSSKPFLRSKGQVLTYAEVDDTVRKLTTLFRETGLSPGDYVLLNVRDDGQLAVIYLACIVNGFAAVVTDPSLPTLDGPVALVEPRLAFIDRDKLASAALSGALKVIAVNEPHRKVRGLFQKLLKKEKDTGHRGEDTPAFPALLESTARFNGAFPVVAPQTTALVLFTSGTTSEPKGVELTQGNIAVQMRILRDQYGVDERAEIFNILPLFHTDGITAGVTLALAVGATLHRPAKFSIHELPMLLDYIFREGITHLFTVPTVLALIQRLGDDFTDAFQSGDFRVLVCSAGLLPPDQWRSFEERFKIRVSNSYGLTETVTMFSFCGPDDDSYRIGSVGTPVTGEVKLVDRSGAEVPTGAEGELLLRGELVMKGYVNNPQATAEAFTDGWLHTGDTARIAEDGKLEILGRTKNIIIRGGINIHPAEITDAALEHDGIIHAAAFGEPDDIWGEIAVLCIVEDPATSPTDEALQAFLEQRLASEKMPGEIHRFADFPRGPAGKVVLRELQEQVAQRRLSMGYSNAGDPLDVILGIGATLLKVPRESLSRSSSADNVNGWDSLFHLNFILAVEKTYAVLFAPRDIMAVRTLGDLVTLAEKTLRNEKAPR